MTSYSSAGTAAEADVPTAVPPARLCPHQSEPAGRRASPGPRQSPATFVALSRFVVANGMTPEVKQAFIDRPHLVDEAPGFVGMDVMSPLDNPDEIWLITFWSDEESYRSWHHGHTYRDSHAGIPKGLRLDPAGTSIRMFEYVAS